MRLKQNTMVIACLLAAVDRPDEFEFSKLDGNLRLLLTECKDIYGACCDVNFSKCAKCDS